MGDSAAATAQHFNDFDEMDIRSTSGKDGAGKQGTMPRRDKPLASSSNGAHGAARAVTGLYSSALPLLFHALGYGSP
ncbi:hypothetical protein [Xanthomonas arboricola]|uniref:hypothetical protein n=1 Tax=Xanthomonas arboricola TaxID=56448 RepID=UPI0015E321C6|nr:hypothetical protein [Xanthomonas arboricola]